MDPKHQLNALVTLGADKHIYTDQRRQRKLVTASEITIYTCLPSCLAGFPLIRFPLL